MALCAIIDEIMGSETNAAITYSNYGSSMNGLGSNVVQSITIVGVQRSLHTLDIFTENRENFKDLKITTLKILSAASGHKYFEEDILKKHHL